MSKILEKRLEHLTQVHKEATENKLSIAVYWEGCIKTIEALMKDESCKEARKTTAIYMLKHHKEFETVCKKSSIKYFTGVLDELYRYENKFK